LGLRIALSVKAAQGKLVIINEPIIASHKTKEFQKIINERGWRSAVIMAAKEENLKNLELASANLPNLDFTTITPSVYQILRRDTLILTKQALNQIQKQILRAYITKIQRRAQISKQ